MIFSSRPLLPHSTPLEDRHHLSFFSSHAPDPTTFAIHHHRQVYAQNMDDLGARMNVVLEFVEGMKAQIAAIDEKLDSLSSSIAAMHKDLKRLAGRPMLDVYKEWADAQTHAVSSELPSIVHVPAKVCGPGPKKNFEVDERLNPTSTVIEAFDGFMKSTKNILLLSGAAGSGKSTAYQQLQHWVLTEYASRREEEGVTVVLLPVSLPQLRDPINGIFTEGCEHAYGRMLRPSHADELRELVHHGHGTTKTELVLFLDAYGASIARSSKI